MFKYLLNFSIVAALCFSFSACDDSCKGVECYNDGQCFDGYCYCPDGFSGGKCGREDKCITQTPTCYNEGYCDNGDCVCPFWYEGDSCTERIIDQWVGEYEGFNPCSEAWTTYYMEVEPLPLTDSLILIKDVTVIPKQQYEAVFYSETQFTIPQQKVTAKNNENLYVEGTGHISDGFRLILFLEYQNTTRDSSYSCKFLTNW